MRGCLRERSRLWGAYSGGIKVDKDKKVPWIFLISKSVALRGVLVYEDDWSN